ncbi:hypothetical protein [Caballeronia grimmiae]|uniref:hypothetical protein n=1 Tax=Caballeronia grimmiae TaxID=1071679 RepID=UPI0038BC8B58
MSTFATHEGKPMSKSIQTAEQIRDEAQRRVEQLGTDVPQHLRVRVPLPERHPPDASGRNWDMLALNESGADYLRQVRRVIEDMRTEFVLPD